MQKRPAYWTYEDHPVAGKVYYFAPTERAAGPYRKQERATAILDIAHDGTLAGVELVTGPLPPAPMPVSVTNYTIAGGNCVLTINRMPPPDNIAEIRAREQAGDKYAWVESASDADLAKHAAAIHDAMREVFPNSAYEGAARAERVLARLYRAERKIEELARELEAATATDAP